MSAEAVSVCVWILWRCIVHVSRIVGLTGPVQLYVLRLTDEIVVCDAVVVQLVMGLGRCIFWLAGEQCSCKYCMGNVRVSMNIDS